VWGPGISAKCNDEGEKQEGKGKKIRFLSDKEKQIVNAGGWKKKKGK